MAVHWGYLDCAAHRPPPVNHATNGEASSAGPATAATIARHGLELAAASAASAPIPCFRCGVCCEKWQPLLAPGELRQVAAALGLTLRTFNRRYTRPYPLRRGWRQFKATAAGCIFLDATSRRAGCTIHHHRPQVCRDWQADLGKRACLSGLRRIEGPDLLPVAWLYDEIDDRVGFVAAIAGRQEDRVEPACASSDAPGTLIRALSNRGQQA